MKANNLTFDRIKKSPYKKNEEEIVNYWRHSHFYPRNYGRPTNNEEYAYYIRGNQTETLKENNNDVILSTYPRSCTGEDLKRIMNYSKSRKIK